MKKLLLIGLTLLCFAGEGYAQKSAKVSKRSVEKSTVKTKPAYNYYLLDQVKAADEVYSRFEGQVQTFWNEGSNGDLSEFSTESIEQIGMIRNDVDSNPAYVGGDEYKAAVIDYINAIETKIKTLEVYALSSSSEVEAYNKAMKVFDEATDIAVDKRGLVRDKKSVYEKTFHIEK